MHYNSPRFYTELKDRSLSRFGLAVSTSFAFSALIYAAIACFGYLTFGSNSSGFILNNYSPHDPLAMASRMAVGISTLVAYPIVFMGVRDGFLDIFEVPPVDQTSQRLNGLTVLLLTALTVISVFVTDLGLINAVGGGLVSSAIVFVFPTIMFRSAVKQLGGSAEALKEDVELKITSWIMVIGVIFGVAGAFIAIQES
jgi:amino acid permease